MPRDGAGTYTRTHADYVYGEVIDHIAVNAELNDIATALTGSLTGKFWWGGIAGGTADARTITPSPSISAYAAGQEWVFINGAAANATATPTLAISGLAPRTCKRADGSALLPGDWPANALIKVIDDGTNLRLVERINGAFSGSFTGTGVINTARATVASAATTADIWGAANQINWTGTTTCTGFPAAPQAGVERILICAAAASFTAGPNMLIDGAASGDTITCAANDQIIVRAVTTTQFKLSWVRYNGRPIVSSCINCGIAGGTADAITLTTAPIVAYANAFLSVLFISTGANTITNPTVNLNSSGARTIFNKVGGALTVGQIPSDSVVMLMAYGNVWRLVNL